jgi:hypothetical protein
MSNDALILIEPDPFLGQGNTLLDYIPQYGNATVNTEDAKKEIAGNTGRNLADLSTVGRPVHGIAVKPNTHAFVQILSYKGDVIKVFNRLGKGMGAKDTFDPIYGGQFSREPGPNMLDNPAPEYWENPLNLTNEQQAEAAAKAARSSVGGAEAYKIQGIKEATIIKASMAGAGTYAEEANTAEFSAPNSEAWTDWLLQSVREQRVEKTQIVETFGDTYLYAFGERPRALEFQGILMNTQDYNWRAVFWENWDKYFRATKLIEANARMYIGWEDVLVEGYPVNAAAAETSDSPNALTFKFTFYVTNYINVSAQRGFVAQKAEKIATIRGGYETGVIDHMARRNLGDSRNRLIEWAGIYGADRAGYLAQAETHELLQGILGEGWLAQNTAQLVGQTVSDAAIAALSIGKGLLISEHMAVGFLSSFLQTATSNIARFASDSAIKGFEDKSGFYSGEVNLWFGNIAAIAGAVNQRNGSEMKERQNTYGTVLSADQISAAGVDPNWLGAPNAGGDLMRAFLGGSLNSFVEYVSKRAVSGGMYNLGALAYEKLIGGAKVVGMKPLGEAGYAAQFQRYVGQIRNLSPVASGELSGISPGARDVFGDLLGSSFLTNRRYSISGFQGSEDFQG